MGEQAKGKGGHGEEKRENEKWGDTKGKGQAEAGLRARAVRVNGRGLRRSRVGVMQ